MARHKSAMKRHRQSERRRTRNNAVRSRVRSVIKQVRQLVTAREATAAAEKLRTAEQVMLKAVTKGVLHKKTASRYLSRLSRSVHALQAA
jgi:small subunit ribosomal protein S20